MKFMIENGNIKELTDNEYEELVFEYAEVTTTPRGVGQKLHIREATIIDEDSGEESTVYEGWTWGHCGNFPGCLLTFETKAESEQWLLECAEHDFYNNASTPLLYSSRDEAESALSEMQDD